MNSNNRIGLLLVAAVLLSTATLTWADAIKERMLKRLPELQALKSQGIIGEDNQGFLQFRKPAPDKKALVSAENADRSQAYKTIAAQQGVSPELVGQQRARKIAETEDSGVWLQKPDGTWYQK